MQVEVRGTRLWFDADGPALVPDGPTMRGHGRSAWGDPASWSFERCADDVRGFCDHLGIVRPVVYGHSLGGFVAMAYAVRHPGHAGALALQSTMPGFDLGRIVEGFRRAGGDAVAAIAEQVYGGDRLMRSFDVVDRLGGVGCPTLVGVGELDPVTPVAAAREIVDALPRGSARLEVIEGAGHFSWRDAPDRYWPLLLQFVSTTARPS